MGISRITVVLLGHRQAAKTQSAWDFPHRHFRCLVTGQIGNRILIWLADGVSLLADASSACVPMAYPARRACFLSLSAYLAQRACLFSSAYPARRARFDRLAFTAEPRFARTDAFASGRIESRIPIALSNAFMLRSSGFPFGDNVR
jgi:hypothetical protein